MVLEFPDDPVTWSKRTQYQFMCGESLLVAPVYEDSPIRNDIYLPAGKWVDYWNGQEYFGPTILNAFDTPLEKLPVFVKAGAILPMYPEMLYDREKPKDPVTFDIYPFGKTSFTMYEDDGVTQDYWSGMFARTTVEVEAPKALDAAGSDVTVKVGPAKGKYRDMPQSRAYVVDVHLAAKPASVKLNDKPVPAVEKREEFEKAAEGWFFDPRDRRGVLHVKMKPTPLASGFTVKVTL